MKVPIIDTKNQKVGEIDLPSQFSEEFRPDIIRRAVHAILANRRQPYGASPRAGLRASADLSRRRRKYRGSYGFGISRVPRKILTRRGRRFNWVGAVAPGTVGGRRAHPPKASKIYTQKINKKERLKAIRSALAASLNKELVQSRGHKTPDQFPFAIDDSFEKLTKTKQVIDALKTCGLGDELARAHIKKIRPGKGKMRSRKYVRKKSLLIVTTKKSVLTKAAKNIPGVDTTNVKNLDAEKLAPGTQPGRLTLFTKEALEALQKEKLFITK